MAGYGSGVVDRALVSFLFVVNAARLALSPATKTRSQIFSEMVAAMLVRGSTAPVASVSGVPAPRQAAVPAVHVLHGGSFTAPARAFNRAILTGVGSRR